MYTYVIILYSVNKELNWIELNWIAQKSNPCSIFKDGKTVLIFL